MNFKEGIVAVLMKPLLYFHPLWQTFQFALIFRNFYASFPNLTHIGKFKI